MEKIEISSHSNKTFMNAKTLFAIASNASFPSVHIDSMSTAACSKNNRSGDCKEKHCVSHREKDLCSDCKSETLCTSQERRSQNSLLLRKEGGEDPEWTELLESLRHSTSGLVPQTTNHVLGRHKGLLKVTKPSASNDTSPSSVAEAPSVAVPKRAPVLARRRHRRLRGSSTSPDLTLYVPLHRSKSSSSTLSILRKEGKFSGSCLKDRLSNETPAGTSLLVSSIRRSCSVQFRAPTIYHIANDTLKCERDGGREEHNITKGCSMFSTKAADNEQQFCRGENMDLRSMAEILAKDKDFVGVCSALR